jgi:hypothetical protein
VHIDVHVCVCVCVCIVGFVLFVGAEDTGQHQYRHIARLDSRLPLAACTGMIYDVSVRACVHACALADHDVLSIVLPLCYRENNNDS